MPLNLASLRDVRQRIPDAVADAARDIVLAKSNEYIPKDTETAERSGRVVVDGETVYVTYGRDDDRNPKTGESSNTYIETLHEDMETLHAPGTGAQFLRRAGDETGPLIGPYAAKRIRM